MSLCMADFYARGSVRIQAKASSWMIMGVTVSTMEWNRLSPGNSLSPNKREDDLFCVRFYRLGGMRNAQLVEGLDKLIGNKWERRFHGPNPPQLKKHDGAN